ncbi:MAG: hypothetical protein QGI84_01560 [Dehalococcoidia bacterium]|jgi:ABC-type dipeptide/oligopeptide/nickel transport system permease component|nr:hypothetical protein [Dehalococcoidia bacterium]
MSRWPLNSLASESTTTRRQPRTANLLLNVWMQFAFHVTFTKSGVYAIVEVGLNPLQSLLVGAVLEGTVLIAEVPTGIVAVVYSRRRSVTIGYAILAIGSLLWASVPRFGLILIAQEFWAAVALRHSSQPVLPTGINRGPDPSVRATVISLHPSSAHWGR